jgi:hypothetical protein
MSATKANWSGPGIIQGFFTLPPDSKLTQETLEKWLDDEYNPAMLETKVVKAAHRFKAANPDYGKRNMVVYELDDLASAKSGELQEVSRVSSLFPSKEPVDSFVESEARILSLIEEYKKEEHPKGLLMPSGTTSSASAVWVLGYLSCKKTDNDTDAAKTIIYAAMEPGEGREADLDAWYREEVSWSAMMRWKCPDCLSTTSKCLWNRDT